MMFNWDSLLRVPDWFIELSLLGTEQTRVLYSKELIAQKANLFIILIHQPVYILGTVDFINITISNGFPYIDYIYV